MRFKLRDSVAMAMHVAGVLALPALALVVFIGLTQLPVRGPLSRAARHSAVHVRRAAAYWAEVGERAR